MPGSNEMWREPVRYALWRHGSRLVTSHEMKMTRRRQSYMESVTSNGLGLPASATCYLSHRRLSPTTSVRYPESVIGQIFIRYPCHPISTRNPFNIHQKSTRSRYLHTKFFPGYIDMLIKAFSRQYALPTLTYVNPTKGAFRFFLICKLRRSPHSRILLV